MKQGNDSPDFELNIPFVRLLINLVALGLGAATVFLVVAIILWAE